MQAPAQLAHELKKAFRFAFLFLIPETFEA